MTLRLRAILLFGGIQLVVMAALISASLAYLYQTGIAQAKIHAEDALHLIQAAVAESLFVVNDNSAREIIDSAFHEVSGITYLQIVGDDWVVIAEKRKGSDLLPDNILKLQSVIELGGATFGKLHLHFTTAGVVEAMQQQLLYLAGFALAGLAVSSAATSFAATRITRTLAAVEHSIKTESKLIVVPRGQELGRLVMAYNALIERVSSRT